MRKQISLLLSLFLVFSVLPVKVNAENKTEEKVDVVQVEKENAKAGEIGAGALMEIEPETGEEAEVLNGTYGDLTYQISNGEVIITKCNTSAQEIVIPETIEGYPVTTIGTSSGTKPFYNCTNLTKLIIPASVTSISYYAFENCTGLNTAGPIGGGYDYEFGWEEEIPYCAFAGCYNLTSVKIPDNVASIKRSAFGDCRNLTNIVIPDNVISIDNFAFDGCTSLSSIRLSNSLTTIGNYAFEDCTNLTTITIPKNVSYFGTMAFQRCTGLEKVYFTGEAPVFYLLDTFNGCGSITAYYPESNSSWLPEKFKDYKAQSITWYPWDPESGEQPGDEEELAGVAFAVLLDSKELVFFRSDNQYENNSVQTVVDIDNNEYTGTVYTGFETSSYESMSDVPWHEEARTIKKVYVADGQTIAPKSMNFWFAEFSNMSSFIDDGFDTSNVTSMRGLFDYAGTLDSSLDLSGFDTSKVTDMSLMFFTSPVKSLDISSFDTSAIENMQDMFNLTTRLESIMLGPKFTKWYVAGKLGNDSDFWTHELSNDDPLILSSEELCSEYPNHANEWAGIWTRFKEFTVNPPEVQESSNDENCKFKFWSQFKEEEMEYTYDYDEKWFFKDTKRYYHNLALMSLKMAMATFADDETHVDNSHILDLYKRLKFENHMITSYYPVPEDNSIGYTIGAKNIEYNGETITLIAVSLRGGGYGQEWAGNFEIGDGINHSGFDQAAETTLEALKSFIKIHQKLMSENIKVWITGYSRAAAVGNLLGVKLDDGRISGISNKDVFCYGFECPRNTKYRETADDLLKEKYDNLYYVFNPIDFVPKVAMEKWGFRRNGWWKAIVSQDSMDYKTYINSVKPNMVKAYEDILSYNGLPNAKYLAEKATCEKWLQPQLLDELFDYIASLAKNPEFYTFYHQDSVKKLIGEWLGDVKIESKTEYTAELVWEIIMLLGGSFVSKYLNIIWNEQKPIMVGSVFETLVDVVKPLQNLKAQAVNIAYLFLDTSNENLDGHWGVVPRGHYPELCLAWMEAGKNNIFESSNILPSDSINAATADGTDEEDDGSSIFGPSTNRLLYVDPYANISIYDEEETLLARIVNGEPEEVEYGLSSYINLNGQRVFVIPNAYECRIEIEATQDGLMTYTCKEHNIVDGDNEKVVSYMELETKAGDCYTGIIENIEEDENAGVYELYKDDEIIEPDISLEDEEIPSYTVSVTVEGDGKVFGGGTYVPGETVSMCVLEGEDNFAGWYDESGTLLSEDVQYSIVVKEDRNITAKFEVKDKIVSFVTRLYSLCFNRKPDQGGLNNWVTKLKNKQITAAQAVTGFFNSKEVKNLQLSNADFIERCYLVMMDRASDAGGKKNWLEKAESGVSNTYILRGFVASKEFSNICADFGIERGTITLTEPRDQNLGITQFVSRNYSEVLGRKADVGGLNNWCNKILTAVDKKKAAINMASTGFFHSREYLNKNTSNDEYVKTLYRTFLGREADTGGYNNWMNKLSSGVSRDEVLMGFANSTEFANIMAKYGIR